MSSTSLLIETANYSELHKITNSENSEKGLEQINIYACASCCHHVCKLLPRCAHVATACAHDTKCAHGCHHVSIQLPPCVHAAIPICTCCCHNVCMLLPQCMHAAATMCAVTATMYAYCWHQCLCHLKQYPSHSQTNLRKQKKFQNILLIIFAYRNEIGSSTRSRYMLLNVGYSIFV